MYNIKQLEKESEFIIRKEPVKIFVFCHLLGLFIMIFALIGYFYKFNISKIFIARIIYENEKYYFETDISKSQLENLENSKLLIENKEYAYELVDLSVNDYNNSYNIFLSIDIDMSKLKNKNYAIINLQTEKTTLFKEILKKIKEELN